MAGRFIVYCEVIFCNVLKKVIYSGVRLYLGEILQEMAAHREGRVGEGHRMGDHIHICIGTSPKC